jgi:acyl-coenzyme A synthetase/AMP-(fatty) acid ligase
MKNKQKKKFEQGMSEETLARLCSGRRGWLDYLPPTVFWTAEAYGFGKYIRKYGYYPWFLPLAIYTEHGVGHLHERPYKHELESYAPAMFYHAPESVEIWKQWSNKPCHVMYSPFVYY